jgi:endoglucanase
MNDRHVACAPTRAGGPPACAYELDASGGWYDAGDQGKYVVNGGIAVWTLMNQWESAERRGAARAFADGTLSIPERKNGAPDLLDEARWELEFLLRMQVPEGQPLAGMVHHKIHDKEWTALGLAPHEDTQPRLLFPPSTAATLNLAATAAQGARLWRKLDAKFATRCLAAAERAWAAAESHPKEFAASGGVGGGPYDDRDLADERYWAAAELFLAETDTAKRDVYGKAMRASAYFTKVPTSVSGDGVPTSMTWDHVQALGTISLALSDGALPPPSAPPAARRCARPPTSTQACCTARATACRSRPERRASRGARARSCSTTPWCWVSPMISPATRATWKPPPMR